MNKVQTKTPLRYTFVRRLSSLNPKVMLIKPENAIRNFRIVLEKMVEVGRLQLPVCDIIMDQFESLLQNAHFRVECENFSREHDRLDTFFYNILEGQGSKNELWSIIKKIMLLSHGQAAVERSFSINKEVTDVNIAEHNLVCRRIVKDHLFYVGGVTNVVINEEMLVSVKAANSSYKAYLEEQRKTKDNGKEKTRSEKQK
jgi:hypothetical protein